MDDQHVCFQEPYVIPPDDKEHGPPPPTVPDEAHDLWDASCTLNDNMDKHEDNLANLVDMNLDKPLDPTHVIESYQ